MEKAFPAGPTAADDPSLEEFRVYVLECFAREQTEVLEAFRSAEERVVAVELAGSILDPQRFTAESDVDLRPLLRDASHADLRALAELTAGMIVLGESACDVVPASLEPLGKTGTPRWICARGVEESSRLEWHKPLSQVRVSMSPSAYLQASASKWGISPAALEAELRRDAVEKMKGHMSMELPLDSAFLDVDVDTFATKAQEGNHRALAARELRISQMPVILYAKTEEWGFTTERERPGMYQALKARFDGRGLGVGMANLGV